MPRTNQNNSPDVAEILSKAAEKLPEQSRRSFEDFASVLGRSNLKGALRCADNAAAVLHLLSPSQQSFFLSQAMELAEVPGAAAEFFLGCADLLHYLSEDDMRAWVEQGRTLGSRNPEAAVAFFRRESLTSISALQRLRQAVRLGEVSRLLQLYSTAIAGKPVGVKSTAEAPRELARAGHHLPLTDGKTVYLPSHLSTHSSHEENYAEYVVLAAHQAGYIEFGTFDLDIDILLDHSAFGLFQRPNGDSEPSGIISHYELFFRLFEDRQLARDIFFAVEDGRVDFRLCEKYRGLARQLMKVARASLEDRPAPSSLPFREALVESLVRLSLSREIEESVPDAVRPLYRRICRTFSRVLISGATVIDSAIAATEIYSFLSALPNITRESPLCHDMGRHIESMLSGEMRSGDQFGISDERHYQPTRPVPYRGQTRPELVQLENALHILKEAAKDAEEDGIPMSPEMLEELLRRGVKIRISEMTAKELAEASNLFITDLKGVLQEKLKELSPEERKRLAKALQRAAVRSEETDDSRVFFYDEWDYLIKDYRPRWCKLREIPIEGESGEIVARIQKERSALISAVRRHFQRIRPEMLRRVKRLRSGEEIELNDAVEAIIDRRVGLTPSDRIYQKRDRRMRDVATSFLLDLSASTDEWVVEELVSQRTRPISTSRISMLDIFGRPAGVQSVEDFAPPQGARRVIDVEREALVIMAEALESLGDEYGIYGFSGYGRDAVEFYLIKDFSEKYSERTRCRIGAIKPRKSTRMGPAIRHTLEKLEGTGCRLKVLILLSDGYPQDFDYGPDRSSREYGLHDTMMALQEARKRNIHTFCVTVDQAGNDYLREMCGGENYLVVKKPSALPRILPRVYRGLTV